MIPVYLLEFFTEANTSLMSVSQAVCFSFGGNTLRELLCMSHPRHVFCSASCLSFAIFLKYIGSSCFRGSDLCSGRNSLWMTNIATLFACSIQCLSSTIMVMMPLMKPSIDASMDVMSNARGAPLQDGL